MAVKSVKPINPLGLLFKKKDADEDEHKEVKKYSVYFTRDEYIKRIKISG